MTFAACPDSEAAAACAEGRLRGDERERSCAISRPATTATPVFTEALHLLDELPALAAERRSARALATTPSARSRRRRKQNS